MAQSGSAPGLGPGGPRFESLYSDHIIQACMQKTIIPFINNKNVKTVGTHSDPSTVLKQNILTSHPELKDDVEYRKIVSLVEKLIQSGVPMMGQGYCISVSDVVMNILTQNNIKCKMIEVQASFQDKATGTVKLIGYDSLRDRVTDIDTHVVVVTETKVPMLIDCSIGHLLPKRGSEVIVDSLNSEKGKDLAVLNFEKQLIVYQEKRNSKIPLLHQSSIINRIETDKKIFDNIKLLKTLNFIGIGLGVLAIINQLIIILK